MALLSALGLGWLSLLCVSLSMWDLPGTPTEQVVDGMGLLLTSAVLGALAVANVRILLGRQGTSWWMVLGAAPAVVSIAATLTSAF